ncbi:MAG: hypothetical protein WKF30_01350 [Pyrinomonadaceae bacterium]
MRLEYLNPAEPPFEGARHDNRSLETWFNWFYGHRDYAVIGRRP